MDELNITIHGLEVELEETECTIAQYFEYGGFPLSNHFDEMPAILQKREKIKFALKMLNDVKEAIKYNNGIA
jgi:hypothetical protein